MPKTTYNFPLHKKGKLRMYASCPKSGKGKPHQKRKSRLHARGAQQPYAFMPKLSKALYNKLWRKVAYVRSTTHIKIKNERQLWSWSLDKIDDLTERQFICESTKDGFLVDWLLKGCPKCGGKVTPLQKDSRAGKDDWFHRCTKDGCQMRILPHHGHLIFRTGKGKSWKPLRLQFKLLFGIVAGLNTVQLHRLWPVNEKMLRSMSIDLDKARQLDVQQKEPQIKFGCPEEGKWVDVEADEFDAGKSLDANEPAKLNWEQWGGIIQRGVPESLVLFKTRPKKTKLRAPGPGPIKKTDWYPKAKKWLKGRKVMLHTDGARSYKLGINRKRRMDGIIHNYVVHRKKKINGRWVHPKFVRLFYNRLPDGGELYTKGGTQVIDRAWRHMREFTRHRNPTDTRSFLARVRSAQWVYWNMHKDLFAATGHMLKALQG